MMDAHFALFNSHVNDAREKAKQVFIEMYGKGTWDEKMQPIIDEGIMSVFNEDPNQFTAVYVGFVFLFVNHEELTPAEVKAE